jgi:hypothetical protein
MATNGNLNFANVNKVTFEGVGGASNAVIDTTTGKIGVGVDSPDANLHVVGNCFVSTNFELGGTMTMGTVTVRAQHELSAITATGNTTPHTVEFQNAETGLVTTGNVEVGKELTVAGNVAVDTDTLFVDSVNDRVGIGTTSPIGLLSIVRDTIVAGVNTYQRGMFYKDGKLQITPPDLYNGYPLDGDFLTTSRYETDGSTDYTAAALGVAYDTVSGSKSALYFKTAVSGSSLTEKMRITGDGNVGVNTTDPATNLHVFHPTYGVHRSIYWSEKPGNPATENPIRMGYLGSSDPSHASGAIGLFKNTYEGGLEDEAVRIQANGDSWFKGGNVGIGTSSPGAPLSILTTSGNHLRLHYNDVYYNTLERDSSGNFNIRASDGVGGINTQMTILPNGNTTINGTISYSTKQATHQKNEGLAYTTANAGQNIKSVTISTSGIAHVHVTGLWRMSAFSGTNGTDTEAAYFNIKKNSTEVTASFVGHRVAKLGNVNDTNQWKPIVLSWSGAVSSGDTINVNASSIENDIEFNELDLNVLVV